MKSSRLKEKYEDEIIKTLTKEFDIKNIQAVPRITKIVLNMGIGEASGNKKLLEQAREDLGKIAGQLPSVQQAKVSVASFGIRAGQPVGLKATLRGDRMYSFLDKLFSIVLPRLRDFRGVSLKSFDEKGNYSLGIKEHTVFPEVELGKIGTRGMEVTLVTNVDGVEESKRLMELLGMPFEKEEK